MKERRSLGRGWNRRLCALSLLAAFGLSVAWAGAAQAQTEPSSGSSSGPSGEDDDEMASAQTGGLAQRSYPHAGPESEVWKTAVEPPVRDQARSFFREGNALVKESLFVQAVDKYEAALSLWDHPAIHYNLALALLNLEQPLRLRQHLLASLHYGAHSLGEDKAQRAEQYLNLVEKQLTPLRLNCQHPGAKVELDGQQLFVAPGLYAEYVLPGLHTVRVSGEGYEPTVRNLKLSAGETLSLDLKLYREEDWVRYERRWPAWGPIATTAAGGVLLATGAVFLLLGNQEMKSFDQEVSKDCAKSCLLSDLQHSKDRAQTLNTIGYVGLGVGGAATLTGGILLYLNRQQARRVDPEAPVPETKGADANAPQPAFLPPSSSEAPSAAPSLAPPATADTSARLAPKTFELRLSPSASPALLGFFATGSF